MRVRKAIARDAPAIVAIILPIIREAATYTLDPAMSESEALAYWMGGDKETFVSAPTICDQIRPGAGLRRTMCEHSLEHARSHGYRAFNFVVNTNERAVRLCSH